MSTAIVTDSTCDIPYHLAEKFNIHIVPNIIVIQGKSVQDDEHFSRQNFYAQLPDMETQPTTSTASSGAYKALYTQLWQESLTDITDIISIHASSVLSGIYNAARLAAQSSENKVQVIDSQQVSMGVEVVHGEVQSLGEVRTRKKGIDRLRNLLQAARPFERLAILHSNAHQAYCYLRHPGHKIRAEDAAGDGG